MRALGFTAVLLGLATCGLGLHFARMGIFAPSYDNAAINYALLAVPLLAVGLGVAVVGGRMLQRKNGRNG